MAAIFISYKRENLQKVQPLVQGLRANGLEVWWDQDIAPDAPWEATIERELTAAKVVIVAWSEAAAASENVKAEARRARNQGKLLQTFVESCEPPLFFGERQGVDLSSWNGEASDHRFQTLLAAVQALLAGRRPPQGVGYAPRKGRPWAALLAVIAVVSTVLGLVANAGGARNFICSLQAVSEACQDAGLTVRPADPVALAHEARSRLLQSIVGVWGRQDRDCRDAVTYSLARGGDGVDRITVRAPGFESVGQVIAAQDGVVMTRATTPAESGGREQWELRPSGDGMVVLDKDGVSTTLVRCSQ